MILFDKLLEIRRAKILFLRAISIGKIEAVESELVRHDHVFVIFDFPSDPMMATDRFEPPNLVLVAEGDAIRFISPVLFQ
jgi:hypothetical protein